MIFKKMYWKWKLRIATCLLLSRIILRVITGSRKHFKDGDSFGYADMERRFCESRGNFDYNSGPCLAQEIWIELDKTIKKRGR